MPLSVPFKKENNIPGHLADRVSAKGRAQVVGPEHQRPQGPDERQIGEPDREKPADGPDRPDDSGYLHLALDDFLVISHGNQPPLQFFNDTRDWDDQIDNQHPTLNVDCHEQECRLHLLSYAQDA